jgi:ElaA protein
MTDRTPPDAPLELFVLAGDDPRLARCLAVRREVFIDEQAVPEADEVDGRDPMCLHLLLTGGGADLGAARLRVVGAAAKAERVAVRAGARRRGLGARLMAGLEAEARRLALAEVVLGAQVDAIPFYERLGYTAEGPVFDDAGIPHRRMRKRLGPPPSAAGAPDA